MSRHGSGELRDSNMKRIYKVAQWAAFFIGCPFLMIGSGLMWLSDVCHDKSL
jgi:hypothetical protein